MHVTLSSSIYPEVSAMTWSLIGFERSDLTLITIDFDEDAVLVRSERPTKETRTPLEHPCITCALREALLPFLAECESEHVAVVLPAGVELVTVAPHLYEALDLTDTLHVVTVVDAQRAVADIVGDTHLSARLLSVDDPITSGAHTEDDLYGQPHADAETQEQDGDVCASSVQLSDCGYADMIIVAGDQRVGSDVIEHCRPHDVLIVPSSEVNLGLIEQVTHSPAAAIERIHPISTRAWGGPAGNGVWTVQYESKLPIHPEQFIKHAEKLSQFVVRGCFWLGSRPQDVCTWECSGGNLSVGTAGSWPAQPFTRLVATGCGGETQRKKLEQLFPLLLEQPSNGEWSSADQLQPWLG